MKPEQTSTPNINCRDWLLSPAAEIGRYINLNSL